MLQHSNSRFVKWLSSAIVLLALWSACSPLVGQQRTNVFPIPLGLIEPDIPKDRPLTASRISLGRKLFFDRKLSATGRMSCATCHNPDRAFTEDRAVSMNALGQPRGRNAQSVLNTGFSSLLDWDGKARSLEEQLDGVFSKWGDMGIDIGEAVGIIEKAPDYAGHFEATFGKPVNTQSVRIALATYQRSLVSGNSRFDRYLFKREQAALNDIERAGYELFTGKASCITCHDIFHPDTNPLGGGIALFTDQRFHNLGIGYKNGRMLDTGRFEHTREFTDWGAFKTPSLRNVELTAPYMHDGSLATLLEVIDFYNRGANPNPNLSPGVRPLLLNTEEKAALVEFLKSLTDETLIPKGQR